jgi:lipopolysaccharide export system protein LptA
MKKFLILLSTIMMVYAGSTKVSISSNNFEADENKHQTTFNGNVVIIKLADKIKSQKAIVDFDQDNKPIQYKVFQNVTFTISLKNSVLTGSCEELSFVPKSKIYILNTKVDITESPTNRKIQASKVIIDTKINKINILGDKTKPVKFIFEVEDK